MRVLLISWEYPPVIEGGLARHVRKLSEHLVASGVEMHVLTRGEGKLARQEERHGVIVHRLRQPPFPRDIDAFLDWVVEMNEQMQQFGRQLWERVEFDLVHSHDWLVADAARRIADRHGLPWLVTIHATEYGRHQGWVDKHPQSRIHAAEREMARRADRLITCSEYMRGHVARVFGVAPRKISAIPNGIDPAELEPVDVDLTALRRRFAAPGELLVLLVGRLVYEKGFHLALDALAPVIRRRKALLAHERAAGGREGAVERPAGGRGVRFVVAGSGTAEGELKRQAARLGLTGHGIFLGWVGDDMLHALYRVCDLCIVPSIYEPFGIVALEAMAAGCPCIVADTGGLREVVPADQTVGLRFPSRDAGALGELLERVLTDERTRATLAARAREHVLRFDWAEVARRTREIYELLVPDPAAVGGHGAPR
jgi:glycogen(starch) synthase